MQAKDIHIRIMTCDRQPFYLASCLATLFASDPDIWRCAPVELMVDGTSDKFLRAFSNLGESIKITLLSPEENVTRNEYAKLAKYMCFSHNYIRCLRGIPEGCRGVVVLEDDCIVRPGFVRHLITALNEMESDGVGPYGLSMNSHGKTFWDRLPLQRGQYYCSYPVRGYYGTQCLYYPRAVAKALAGCLEERSLDKAYVNNGNAGDLHIGRFFDELWQEHGGTSGLYSTNLAFVEHIGERSTGLGGGDCWNSPTFDVPMQSLEQLKRRA